MKWYIKKTKIRDTRIIQRFLFLPKLIDREYRWLCNAIYEQQYIYNKWSELDPNENEYIWKDTQWLD